MQTKDFNSHLFSFIDSSPTPFHAVNTMSAKLTQHGFIALHEGENWELEKGGSYLTSRDDGALIAFTLGTDTDIDQGFKIVAAHTDSPCLKIKPQPDMPTGSLLKLGVEKYGGSLLNPWFDRDLSLAGRVCCECSDGSLRTLLIDFKRAIITIPSLAIHLDREANKNKTVQSQQQLPPIIGQSLNAKFPEFDSIIKDQISIQYPDLDIDSVLSFDMFCYDPQPSAFLGVKNEFISAGRLDNLLSCFIGTACMASADKTQNTIMICTNHEENGSVSTSGASGAFIDAVFERIVPDPLERRVTFFNSFLISMDNAHATHPNFTDKSDPAHEIHLNKGPVIKNNANQRYATNAVSSARYKRICKQVNVTPQEFVMRSDMACGSTVGPMTAARLGIETIDIGAPTLAMHSIRELTGSNDPILLFKTLEHFFKTPLR